MPSEDVLIPVDQHLERILSGIAPLSAYDQELLDCLGLPIAEDIVAPAPLPGFDNSGMDGYAVCHDDLVGASPEQLVRLPVVGDIAAGAAQIAAIEAGTTARIMTGAPIPAGCTAVVPVEWTDEGTETVVISRAPREGQHIRRAGEDVRAGEMLIQAGTVIGPREVSLLASVGRARVLARPRPRVVVISTGSELRKPGEALGPDSIYDSNSYMLAAQARAAGAIAYRVGLVSDDPEEFRQTLSDQLVRADVVVTSGGVSKGAFDVVKEVLASEVRFDTVAMQPGKPQGFGFIGEDSTPIFTLPGNPVSSYVSFEVFVLPALRTMMGRMPVSRPMMRAVLTKGLASAPGKRQFLRAYYQPSPTGATVTPVGGPGSHLVAGLARANAIVVLAEHQTSVAAGEMVPVLVLDRDF